MTSPHPAIRIVLVETSHPGNIGAAARAMKTMRLTRLFLVKPKFFPHPDATVRASGADDVLAGAVVCETLAQALADTGLVIGSSARLRALAWPQLDPRACGELALAESQRGQVALVFGHEQSGLSNAELDLCHYLVHIPCNPEYGSLNLAAAVQVLSYEIMMATRQASQDPHGNDDEERPAEVEDVERFYAHLEETLIGLEFLYPDNPRHLMRRLRRLFQRARLSHNEVSILRGILTAAGRPRQR